METPDLNPEEESHFYERYSDYSDEEILEILRRHKDYQDRAVNQAVKIAIERKLIHSEQDLMSPEFQYSKVFKFTLFPVGNNKYHRERLTASIFRYLYVLSLLPVIYGILKYAEGNSVHLILGLFTGLTWFTFSLIFSRTRKMIFSVFLLIILFMIAAAIGSHILSSGDVQAMDMAILLIGLLLSAYLLVYLRKLISI